MNGPSRLKDGSVCVMKAVANFSHINGHIFIRMNQRPQRPEAMRGGCIRRQSAGGDFGKYDDIMSAAIKMLKPTF